MKFNNFKVDLTRDACSVNGRIAKKVRFANTFGKSVSNKKEEKDTFLIHRKKYSSGESFLDRKIDIEISFSISRS